jgi:hypothetical protein
MVSKASERSSITDIVTSNSVSQKDALRCVENCLVEIVSWMNSNMLKINVDKTEVIVFTSQKNEKHIEPFLFA